MKTIIIFFIFTFLFSFQNYSQVIEPIDESEPANESSLPVLVGEAGTGWIYFGIRKSTVSSMFHGSEQNKTNLALDSLLPDKNPPVIQIISPEIDRGFKIITTEDEIKILVKITDESEVFEVKFNNDEIVANQDGLYLKIIKITDNENIITIKAKDIYENVSVKQLVINKGKVEIRDNNSLKKSEEKLPPSGNNSQKPQIQPKKSTDVNYYKSANNNSKTIEWVSPKYSNISTSKQKYKVKAGIAASDNISEVKLYLNNNLISNRLTENEDPTLSYQFIVDEMVDLQFGKNTLRIEVSEGENVSAEEIVITKNSLSDNYYAVIIGINDYKDEKITDLNEPIKDIEKLQEILIRNYNFSPDRIKLLKNPDKSLIISTLHELRSSILSNDNLFIFYAGHGTWDQEMNTGYWLPADASPENPVNWIPNTDLTNYINAIKSQHTLLVADACFSGSIFKTRNINSENQAAIEKLYGLKSRKAITSGTMKQEVPDKSTFTHYLIKKLEDNEARFLTAEQLFLDLRLAVLNNSANVPQYGTIQNTGDEGGEFIFVKKEE
jgi:hypothetical protein